MKFLIALLLFGCSDEAIRLRVNEHARSSVNDLRYVFDTKTGLCFATGWNGHSRIVLATVPCENVRPFLINN